MLGTFEWISEIATACFLFAPIAASQTAQAAQHKSSGQQSTPEEFVDALNAIFGKQQPGMRAVHSKGVDLEGVFRPSESAAAISRAPHLQQTSVPVIVRFSPFAGIPTIPDTDGMASPRGMSIRFHLPDGTETDIVAHSYNGFPAATADAFRQLLLAIAASGPSAAKPTALQAYVSTHPAAKAFLENQIPPPVSYSTVSYFGVNTFKFTNAKDRVTYGRYQIRPVDGEHSLPADQVSKADANYLAAEILERVSHASAKFKLMLEIAEPADKLQDPSIAWPESRRKVELGTIEITQAVADNGTAERNLLFIPGALPSGIEAEDPMIKARSDAYPVSYQRRSKAE
jgi:catalase